MESVSRASDAAQSAWTHNTIAERVLVKEEPEWGESEVAVAEGLYAGHEIKDELVLGPERIQMPDVAFSMQSEQDKMEEDPCKLKPVGGARAAPECSHTRPGEGPRCDISQYSSDDAKFANAAISYSHILRKTRFRNQSDLTIHTDVTPGSHICDACSKEFSHKQHLIRHIRKVHTDDRYICHICKKPFRHRSWLTVHLRVHTREKPFTCDVCKKQFTVSCNLNKHRRIHTGEKPFSCNVCNKQFAQKSILIVHMLTHTGEQSYSCDVCEKKFAQKSDLTKHTRIHIGERPFTCDVCKKQFKLNGDLTRHRRIHTGEKPFPCSVCNKQFTRKSDLSIHIRTHTSEK